MTSDAEIGARVRDLRVARGMNQTDLSSAMRAEGHAWTQPGTARVELGKRPVRLVEAISLARVLGVSMHTLLDDPCSAAYGDGYRDGVAAVRTHLERFDA